MINLKQVKLLRGKAKEHLLTLYKGRKSLDSFLSSFTYFLKHEKAGWWPYWQMSQKDFQLILEKIENGEGKEKYLEYMSNPENMLVATQEQRENLAAKNTPLN